MSTTLALVKKEQSKKPEESALQYADRTEKEAFWKLHNKQKRTKDEEEEHKELERKMNGQCGLNTAQIPAAFADLDLKSQVERVHRELSAQFGSETPQKKMLIQRLASAWGQVWSYERMFAAMKYQRSESGETCSFSFSYSRDRIYLLTEVRKGIETVNDQIIRLTQALQHLVSPPIQVMARNAIVAQNMQINQGVTPKDFDKKTPVPNNSENNAKTPA
ncbi:MAG: hypothetical protein ABIG34_04850 [Candidatus Peregrinibacteria bacterium]